MKFVKLTAAALSIALGATVAMAQTATTPAAPVAPKAPLATTPAPTAGTPAATTTKKGPATFKAKTAEGVECSAEADAKGLKGKERRSFRNKCKKEKLAAAKKS